MIKVEPGFNQNQWPVIHWCRRWPLPWNAWKARLGKNCGLGLGNADRIGVNPDQASR